MTGGPDESAVGLVLLMAGGGQIVWKICFISIRIGVEVKRESPLN